MARAAAARTGVTVMGGRVVDLDDLNASQLDELGALMREEARRRRQPLAMDRALAAFDGAVISAAWEGSVLADVGRLRAACRRLIVDGWHAEQIANVMVELGEQLILESGVAELAVAAGIADGLRECRRAS